MGLGVDGGLTGGGAASWRRTWGAWCEARVGRGAAAPEEEEEGRGRKGIGSVVCFLTVYEVGIGMDG